MRVRFEYHYNEGHLDPVGIPFVSATREKMLPILKRLETDQVVKCRLTIDRNPWQGQSIYRSLF